MQPDMNIEYEYDVELIPLAKACEMLDELPETLGKNNRTAALTVDGKPVLVVIPWDLYESMVETMEIMEDTEMMDGIREGIRDMREGSLFSHEEVAARLRD